MSAYRKSVASKGGHIRLSEEDWTWIDEEADRRGVSRARLFEYMVSRFREAAERQKEPTRQREREDADHDRSGEPVEDRRSAEQQVPVLPSADSVP